MRLCRGHWFGLGKSPLPLTAYCEVFINSFSSCSGKHWLLRITLHAHGPGLRDGFLYRVALLGFDCVGTEKKLENQTKNHRKIHQTDDYLFARPRRRCISHEGWLLCLFFNCFLERLNFREPLGALGYPREALDVSMYIRTSENPLVLGSPTLVISIGVGDLLGALGEPFEAREIHETPSALRPEGSIRGP